MFMTYIFSFLCTNLLFLSSLWMEIGVILAGGVVLFIAFTIRINQVKHQKYELQRQLHEKTELLIYADIREHKVLDEMMEVNTIKKNLLSRINREIRTPMNGIMGMVSLLVETPLSPEQKEYNQTIRSCGESLLTVINDILLSDVLAHAKVDSKAAALEQKDFDLRNAIEEVFDVFASQTATANIELVYQVDHRIPSQVIGDSTRLRQVLMNLVENSIKFTKQGEIFIKVWVRGEEAHSMDLGFEIHDSGIGIASDQVDYLMNTISRADAMHAGVGLVLCHRLVDIMGGTFKIESRFREGTVVHFNVKVSVGSYTLSLHPDMVGLEGKKILIVEDNITLRNVLKDEIMFWKLIPVVAESGKQALEILSREPSVDLVLAEMQMPEMDGAELSKQIREQYPVLPIILVSVSNGEESNYSDIFSSVVYKPIRYNILSQHILSGLLHKGDAKDQKIKMSAGFAMKNPLRILIAEDNRVNQKLTVRVLGKLGYDPDIAENGKEVLEEVSKVNYDLILMDVQMPEMDGLEATRMIRLCLSSQPVIIAMTANAMQGDREECINAGMDDYLSKPVNIEELVIILEKWALKVKARQL